VCGLTGFLQPRGFSADVAQATAEAMSRKIAHRGPDDWGVWTDAVFGIALSHRRLSVLDLSAAGHQPMVSGSGRFVIAFNGEIYNHLELRKELGEIAWRGHSDTETLLAGFDAWGVESTLARAVGMFAIALWDREERSLCIARDRLGEKPLYYGWQGDALLFGSELKALKSHPAFRGEINRDALTLLLRHNYIPAPHSIYRGIQKLPAGTVVRFMMGSGNLEIGNYPEPRAYWSLRSTVDDAFAKPFAGDDRDAIDALELQLKESIGLQMIADVPLGAFLSGGVDSSTIVALMQAQSSRPVKTFTIGFQEDGYNEAEYSRAVAKHLRTEHTELYVTPDEARSVIPRLPTLYDEPFSDSSQIPTFLVSQMARQHVKVALSGDGGDELFGGYNRYFLMRKIWRYVRRLPPEMRHAIVSAIEAIPPRAWNLVYGGIAKVLPRNLRSVQLGDKTHKLAEIFECKDPEAIYYGLISHWKQPMDVVMGAREPETIMTHSRDSEGIPDIEQFMMYLDALSYLPDDVLVKVDRAAMGVGLETRAPFLDHRVVELAWRLPLSMKIRNGQGKWILRQVLNKHVPKVLTDRPKMGFGVPIDSWLRGPLREWAEALLNEGRLRREGFFNPEPIRQKWAEHLTGQRNWQYHLWDVLMFQAWLEKERAH
jgi:asparagine synthase (glutamine-hydrolysing)